MRYPFFCGNTLAMCCRPLYVQYTYICMCNILCWTLRLFQCKNRNDKYVVVQYYPWLNFYFPFSWCMIMSREHVAKD